MAGYKFGRSMPLNWYAAVTLCHFFKVALILPDLTVKIKTG